MASSTTNLDLILPVGGENVSRQIINANNVKIDEAVGAVPSGTDLQSQVTALNNNFTTIDGFLERKVLSTATDFNTILANDKYNKYFKGTDLSIHTNIPSGSWSNRPFDIDVVSIGYGYSAQVLRVYDSAVGPRTFTRQNYYTSSTPFPFTPWQELARDSEKVNVIQTQLNLPSAVSIPADSNTKVLDNANLRNLTYSALDPIPASGTIVGVQFLWANSSNCVAVDTLVASNTSVSMTLRNVSASPVSVSALRMLIFIR